MIRKKLIEILISSIILVPLLFVSCNNSTKKITISEDTQTEIALEESEVLSAITDGEKLIDEGKFEEAKEEFIKAVNLDKTNKEMYLRIKDKYLSVDKTDEAYYFIKTAVTNNVDVENMKSVLKDISDKFEKINIQTSVYQNSNYSLPQEVSTMISGEQVNIPVSWENQVVDTANIGTFTFQGYNEEYGRNAVLDLTVLENSYERQYGFLKNIKTENGKTYLYVDLIELYLGYEALPEAIKDNKAGYDEERKEYFIPDPIYIRNNYNTISTYLVDNNTSYYLCAHNFFPEKSELKSGDEVPVSLDEFSAMNTKYLNDSNYGLMVWFDIKNGTVTKISQQYRP
ncbi:tetratricopeptide repeat protein [Clostridium tertium]|uniref:Bacterial Ig-like domain-containing protein n=1 Tax=Clostridium tertium TaxID=1559 RepID=A0A6N3DTM4_9CLOT